MKYDAILLTMGEDINRILLKDRHCEDNFMKNAMTIAVTKISAFLNQFEIYGVTKKQVIEQSNVSIELFDSPDNRLSSSEVYKIIQTATKLTKNDNVGLNQGELISRGFSNILGYILMNCSSIQEAWAKYIEYEKIIDETSLCSFKCSGNLAILSSNTVDVDLKSIRQFEDFKIAGMLAYIKLLTGKELKLKEVWFTYPKPSNLDEHKRIFECKIHFNEQVSALVFDERDLSIPTLEPNQEILYLFEKQAREAYAKLENNNNYTRKTKSILLSKMKGSLPSIKFIADELGISVRSFQLYLQNEQTTYSKLVDEIRKDMSESYLKDKKISIDEISYILGFSEVSTFHRAYKKWTDMTPGQFRKNN